ncbi:Immunoglobulin kappa constant [Merluccius polli]|nr:Immunoglobulin kappa constant [Merluccius polli]
MEEHYDVGVGAAQAEPPSLPPQWSRSRAALHCCVRPAGASPRTGRLAGRWGAAACLGGCQIVWGVLGKDGRYSWSSTLTLPADQWRKAGSVSCEASKSGQTPVAQTLNPDQC